MPEFGENKKLQEEIQKCMLCYEPMCSENCINGLDPAGVIRSLRFENKVSSGGDICHSCGAPCINECLSGIAGDTIDIKFIMEETAKYNNPDVEDVDLGTDFCGIHTQNPFFLSSSCIAGNYEMCARALKMGWAGLVYKTIGFFIPDEVSPRFDTLKYDNKIVGFRNLEQISDRPLEDNLKDLTKLKKDFPDKIIIVSIMGESVEEWKKLAVLAQDTGCDMLELNFSCPQMVNSDFGSDVGQNPELVKEYTEAVKSVVDIPVLAKMTPNLGNIIPPSKGAIDGGADGLVAINTLKSLTSVDLNAAVPNPGICKKSAVSGLSGRSLKPVALRFVSDISRNLPNIPISATGGVENWKDAVEFMLLGAENVQITTAVMLYGYRIIDDLIFGLKKYMKENNFTSTSDFIGKAVENVTDSDKLDRKTMVYPVFDKKNCVGCGRCYISCSDGGHSALKWDKEMRKPLFLPKKCVGCMLCCDICPSNAVKPGNRFSLSKRR